MNLKNLIFLFLFLITISFSLNAQEINNKVSDEKSLQNLSPTDERQNALIHKLDSTITHLKNENDYLKKLVEKDIDHAKSLINATETIVEFIAVLLAVFTVVGGFIIAKMFRQSNQINKDHKVLLRDWEKTRKEIDDLKKATLKEGKELLQILFYITEGDNRSNDRPEEAIKFYEKARNLREDNLEPYRKLGHAYLKLGEYNKAISYFKKGNKISPKNNSLLTQIARAHRKNENYDEAEKYLKQAIEIDDNDELTLSEMGKIHLLRAQYEKAKVYFDKIFLTNQSYLAHFNLAFVYLGLKENVQSEEYFNKALKTIDNELIRSPKSTWFKRCKAITLIGLSKFDDAEKLLSELKNDNLNPSEIQFIRYRLKILYDINKDNRIETLVKMYEN